MALGNSEPDLVRPFEVIPELRRSWRILAHPDARGRAGVSAFFEVIAAEGAALRPVLAGEGPMFLSPAARARRAANHNFREPKP